MAERVGKCRVGIVAVCRVERRPFEQEDPPVNKQFTASTDNGSRILMINEVWYKEGSLHTRGRNIRRSLPILKRSKVSLLRFQNLVK